MVLSLGGMCPTIAPCPGAPYVGGTEPGLTPGAPGVLELELEDDDEEEGDDDSDSWVGDAPGKELVSQNSSGEAEGAVDTGAKAGCGRLIASIASATR